MALSKLQKSNYEDFLKIFKSFNANKDWKAEFRKETGNLFNKLAKFRNCCFQSFWEEISKFIKKLQSPGLDTCGGSKLLMYFLNEFVSGIRYQSDQKLKEYERKAKKLRTRMRTEYVDINNRRITSKLIIR